MSALKWIDVSSREYLELTTKRMQYHWTGDYDGHSGTFASKQERPWISEIKPKGQDDWVKVGEFRTGREAKHAAIVAFGEKQ